MVLNNHRQVEMLSVHKTTKNLSMLQLYALTPSHALNAHIKNISE